MSRLCGYNTEDAKQSVDKYTSKEYICALKGYIYILPAILCIIVLSIMTMTGCSKNESKEHEVIDYTVVENEDLPAELKKLIDNKKNKYTKNDIHNERLYICCCRFWN